MLGLKPACAPGKLEVDVKQLELAQKNEKAKLELVIENGLNSFIEVGRALAAIKDKRLYRYEFKTFDEYCREKWQLTRQHVYNKIQASKAAENVNESLQTRPKLTSSQPSFQMLG